MLRTFATLALAAGLGGCATPYNVGIPVADSGTVALLPGESASLPDGLLRYVRLVGDSRCPPDVQCVWAGDASIELEWRPGTGASRTLTLHLNPQAGPDRAALDGRSVAFTALARDTARASLQVTRTP